MFYLYLQKLHKLKMALNDEKIFIQFLPQTFERHMQNKTHLQLHTKTVFWSIEWIFVNADNLKILEHAINENKKLSSPLHKYFIGETESFYKEKLHYYQSAGFANISLFLAAENVKGDKYFELDLQNSIKMNLEGKTIIEYPIIYVVLNDHKLMFTSKTVDTEEEIEVKLDTRKSANSANKVLTNILNEERAETSKKSRNLLFISEYSDVEMSDEEL